VNHWNNNVLSQKIPSLKKGWQEKNIKKFALLLICLKDLKQMLEK
jgi:hypothetical protein